MTKFLRKLNDRRIAFFVCAAVYLVFGFISRTALKDVYTVEWAAHNLYGYTWVTVLAFLIFDNTLPAYFITFGSIAGAFIGEVLGNYILQRNISRIASDMSELEVSYILNTHQGWFIWSVTVFISFVVGVTLSIILSVRRKRVKKARSETEGVSK